MNKHFKDLTLKVTGANEVVEQEEIQSLWSGYGSIVRLKLIGSDKNSVVAKHVKMPSQKNHPRGWNTDFSHLRKVKSYEVESHWYQHFAAKCNDFCKVPDCLFIESKDDEVFMVMEDLDASGYSKRHSAVSWNEIETCLKWLAYFHATFLNEKPNSLWPIGTYWHLDTRPDELKIIKDKALKDAAPLIDRKLNTANYLTFVHGDAKLANFCFSEDGKKVAAVDFQYVGGGCGMKDVAYFIGSCMYEEDCEKHEEQVLDFYFKELRAAIQISQKHIEFTQLEKEWRELYPVAWTDFHRFLKGWSPDHWKINSYSEKLARKVIKNLA
jgi:thiamine kinase-like enzyme